MRVAVVGGSIGGLVSAYVLAKAGVDVVLYEKEDHLAAHAKTVVIDGVELNLDFIFFNPVTGPNALELFESVGVETEVSPMSFSMSLHKGAGCAWGTHHGMASLFANKKNVLNLQFWKMLREIIKFKHDATRYVEELENNPDIDRNDTLGHFVKSQGYSDLFQKAYLVPICSSLWPCPTETEETVMGFSAYLVLSFLLNHHLLQLFGRPQWLTLKGGSRDFANKVREELESRGCQIRSGCEVHSVSTVDEDVKGVCAACFIVCEDGSQESYDGCIMAVHAPDALKILGEQATYDETRVLGSFNYVYSDVFLHRDKKLMPPNPAAWGAWNFLQTVDNKVCLTYWLNVLKNIDETMLPFLATLNPSHTPNHTLLKWSTGHPVPSIAASKASLELKDIQGKRGIWFSAAYWGYGFHEDELKAGLVAANGMLKSNFDILSKPKHMEPSLIEIGARLYLTRFLGHFIATGCLVLLEEGGSIFTFEGTKKKSLPKVYVKVYNPQFYWKVVTQADLGLADAYINGDFSFIDENDGLLNILMIFIANRELKTSVSWFSRKRGWWTPLLLTSGIASAKFYFQHTLRNNTLTQARRNISRHYDLSNELFSLFLDETMQYSCAIFETEDEDLKVAQLRKIYSLIEKARIEKDHEILEIGCGWGGFAIEVVKRTGCKYTGITLSEEQLKYAKMKVKEAGLQDPIRLLLCDYRQLPVTCKYNRIISCEMIEAVGHKYMEEFFSCCESVLAEDGLFVLQFTSVPDARYDEERRTAGFMSEYMFPGACLPSLGRLTSAMAAASRLSVEHVENIGPHYYQTLRCWKKIFMENHGNVLAYQKFIRTWEYYFDYCAAGFKSRAIGNYQVVLSRHGNVAALGDAYKGVPSAFYSCPSR